MVTRHRAALGFVLALILLGAGLYWTMPERPNVLLGDMSFNVEVVRDKEAQSRGLSGRVGLPTGDGMLFAFDVPSRYGFWMKDMLFPIDIFWLGDNGQVVALAENIAPETYPRVFYPPTNVQYVLETSGGTARAFGIATGTSYTLKNIETVSK